jgi:Asp/Glu/hydantoin racemase
MGDAILIMCVDNPAVWFTGELKACPVVGRNVLGQQIELRVAQRFGL